MSLQGQQKILEQKDLLVQIGMDGNTENFQLQEKPTENLDSI